MRLCNRCQR